MARGRADLSLLLRCRHRDPPDAPRARFRGAARPCVEPPSMKRGLALVSVLSILALSAAAVLFGAAWHYFPHRTTGTMIVAGQIRPYIVHVPERYDPAKPTALVMSFHG